MNQEEVWKKIEGFPKYEVSNRGNIRNIKLGKMLRGNMDEKGYFVVQLLTEDQQRIAFPVHKLVAQYFIDNPNGYTKVGHIDRDLRNNNVENLRWETCSQIIMKKRKQKQITSSIYKGVSFRKRYNKCQSIQAHLRVKQKLLEHMMKQQKYILKSLQDLILKMKGNIMNIPEMIMIMIISVKNRKHRFTRVYHFISQHRSGKKIYLGQFETELEAAKAYDEAAKREYKELAVLNLKEDESNNIQIKQKKEKSSIYRGVLFLKQAQKWQAHISLNKVRKNLGLFKTELEAARAYDKAAKELHKEFAILNLNEDESNNIEIKQKKEKSSIYKGVTFNKEQQKWKAYIRIDKKIKHLGSFETELEAARAYDKAAKELHKECAKLNLKDEEELTEQLANLNINEDKQE